MKFITVTLRLYSRAELVLYYYRQLITHLIKVSLYLSLLFRIVLTNYLLALNNWSY